MTTVQTSTTIVAMGGRTEPKQAGGAGQGQGKSDAEITLPLLSSTPSLSDKDPSHKLKPITNPNPNTGLNGAASSSPRAYPTTAPVLAPGLSVRQESLGPPPGRQGLLKRATNLYTASGEPSTPAFREFIASCPPPGSKRGYAHGNEFGGGTGLGNGNGNRKHRKGTNSATGESISIFGVSLRRTLTEVKNSGFKGLKRSLSGKANRTNIIASTNANSSAMTTTRHGRSLSESLPTGEDSKEGHAEGAARKPRRGATLPLSSGISEATALDKASTPAAKTTMDADVKVPLLLQEGTPMTKVSAKKKKTVLFRIDPDEGYVLWESKKSGIIPIENIKEIRSGADARYYREQFQLSQEYESRWLTLVYIADGRYKTLHAVATTPDVFRLWDRTLRALHAVRQELMSGLGHVETRQSVWEKRYWRGADEHRDDRLCFEEVDKMCRRLNLNFSKEELKRRFEEADTRQRGYLDFDDFRKFVRLLKERPEINRLYKKLAKEGPFDFKVFEKFMKECQKSTASVQELEIMFRKHATPPATSNDGAPSPSPPEVPATPYTSVASHSCVGPTAFDQQQASTLATSVSPSVKVNGAPPSTTPAPEEAKDPSVCTPEAKTEAKPEEDQSAPAPVPPLSSLTLSLDGFTNFLLSTDNCAFADQNGKVWQDMTRPLPEYYISSSHNTYLVGHQLVGVSTIEGYIRALLHSCRSVEIDIYDGETEPVIYHGKTLTSKVPLRDICQAIAKYAFVASPYPVIISAEVHCSLAQQSLVASIMRSVFGNTLVSAPPEGRPVITRLPSPEDLKGCVLLKAKNLYVTEGEGLKEKKVTVDMESSESSSSSSSTGESSASESEGAGGRDRDVKTQLKRSLSKARNVDAVKEIKEELSKARSLYERVRGKKSASPPDGLASPPDMPKRATTIATTLSDSCGASLASPASLSISPPPAEKSKVKMSLDLLALLVYTVGVKCRGFNKKETYAPEHVFSLSERMANKVLKHSMLDLIKHNRSHLVRIYPAGFRLSSSNYEPHRYWAAGAQLVAINWQTFDLGYMINHSMFQRNGRAGYVLKPPALRNANYKELLAKRTNHVLDLTIISAQQLPRRKDSEGREIIDGIVDPYVEVSIHVPDWSRPPYIPDGPSVTIFPPDSPSSASTRPPPTSAPSNNPQSSSYSVTSSSSSLSNTARTTTVRTGVVKNNGFNPVWEETLSLPFDCVGDMFDLIFLRVAVRDEREDASDEPLAVYCVSLGSLLKGYRHLPLHDAQLSQYLFSTLFVHVRIRDV